MIPLTPILTVYLVIFLAVFIFELFLERLNLVYLEKKGATVPRPFQATISPTDLKQIHSYHIENTKFSMIQQTVVKLIFLAIVLSGMLPLLSEKLQTMPVVPAGLIFFGVIGFLLSLSTIPFDYYHSFGYQLVSPYIGIFLVGVLWEPVGFLLSPAGKLISRKFERQADRYSFKAMKTAKPLSAALKKMAKDNLANLDPHPLYVCFHYSHPPLLERIEYLESQQPSSGSFWQGFKSGPIKSIYRP